jgi:hypothetical protein
MAGMHAAAVALTALSIVFSPNNGGPQTRWTLSCGPAGGTLSGAAQACARLQGMDNPFLPVPANMACTDVYGGPETARVVGTFRGRHIWVVFRRTNGCEIARWRRVSFLFPAS